LTLARTAQSQTAFIADAWWTFRQDCDGDGNKAGTLPDNLARLNWAPDVANCNGTLTVFEVVSHRSCGTATWTPIYTNTPHSITGCGSVGQQYVDVQMGSAGTCREVRIQVFRNGRTNPDDTRSPTNDVDLGPHREELLAEDFCLSDFFATCVTLNGSFGSESDNNSYATREAGEPAHAGNAGGHSAWYCWTAPTNRPVTFDTIGSGFDTLLAVYTGNNLATLTVVTNNDDIAGWTNRFSRVTFTPVTGTTYRIAVDGFGGASGLTVLNWNQTGSALPDLIIWGPRTASTLLFRNETFSSGDCEVVEGCIGSGTHRLMRFDNETRNIGSGDLVLGNPANNPLFVYASCHGHYHFEQYMQYDLIDTNGNVAAAGHKVGFCLLDVGRWSPTANPSSKYNCTSQGIQSGWFDVYTTNLACQYIDITGVPPGNYLLQMVVNPDNLIAEANYENNLVQIPITIPPATCATVPPNDLFANAITVGPLPFTYSGGNNCAAKQGGEPNHAGNGGGHSIWFNWTPASNHVAVITTKRSSFDTLLAVYTGNSVSTLTPVASNNDLDPSVKQSQVSFAAVAGTTYRIAVDGFNGAVGSVALNVGPPGNDDFTNRYLLTGAFGHTNGFTIAASKQPSEPAHAADVGGHSIWYQWTAPGSGPVDFNTRGSSFDTTLAVYTNTVLSTTQTVVASDDDDAEGGGLLTSRLSFFATAGRTYQIAVDGFGGDSGEVTLNWNMESRLTISRRMDGNVELNLTGVDWQRYTLQGSTNLANWTTNAPTITMSGGAHSYTNSPATNSALFFRANRVP
jgi:lysyl oxidase